MTPRRWSDEVADTRDELANSGKVVMDAVNGSPDNVPGGDQVAVNEKPVNEIKNAPTDNRETKPVENKPSNQTVAANDKPAYVPLPPPSVKEEPKEEPTPESSKTSARK